MSRARTSPLKRFFLLLGPGLTTGASDNDPSGIATYSIVGAQLGTSLLWTAFVTMPLMGFVQFMCARIGMVTGRGLAGALRQLCPRWLLVIAAAGLLGANIITIGADLAGMSDAGQMLTGINSHLLTIIFGAGIAFAIVKFRYNQIAFVLKWLTLALFAYVITAFIVKPHWGSILHDTFIPSWPHGKKAWQSLVAVLGTTISPYLFFWQTSQEVEEEKAQGRRLLVSREGASKQEIKHRGIDVGVGAFFSNLIMYFILLTAALTLHPHHVTNIESSRQVAQALEPLAGSFAAILYTIGLIGAGFLAIPILAGSSAYAFAETFAWKEGLDMPIRSARYFYALIGVSTLLGIAMVFVKINPIEALFLASVINGVLAPFLLVAILIISSNRILMKRQPSPWMERILVGLTAVIMFIAAGAMFFV
ncbi:MAG: iron transporter [Verrucomicrobia bacterium]|nr:MAG: iron transporter [Verrucomicrobiota bacterium]